MQHKMSCYYPQDRCCCGAIKKAFPTKTQPIFDMFHQAGHEIYLVGGTVRDLLLGKSSNDYDFATSAHPQEIIQVLQSNGLPVYPIGIEFGTIQTKYQEEKIEITTYRCEESYTKGNRKPQVAFGQHIKQDLARRDFTINAMAMDDQANIIDPHWGQKDLHYLRISTPINPNISFSDDPLRMLRAVRFVARYNGIIDSDTACSIKQNAHLMSTLSAERIFEELTKILSTPGIEMGLSNLVTLGLMQEVLPEIHDLVDDARDQGKYHSMSVWEHTKQVVKHSLNTPPVRWAALFHDVSKPTTRSTKGKDVHYYGHAEKGATVWEQVAQRLKTSSDFKDHVAQLIYEHQNLRGEMGEKGIRRLVHRLGPRLDNLFALREADILAHKPSIVPSALDDLKQLERRVRVVVKETKFLLPKGTGTKVAQYLNITAGPELGAVMKSLQQKVVDGDIDDSTDILQVAKEIYTKS